MKPQQTTAVFFPPRIVKMDLSKGDSHEIMNDARDRYCAEGLIALDEEGLKDAMKIIQYAAGFPRVCDPDWQEEKHVADKLSDFFGGIRDAVRPSTRVPVSQEREHDMVNHPPHYIAGRSIEPIDVIEDWKLCFHRGNALKYIARSGRKDSEEQDLEKAIWYLQRRLALLRKSSATS